MATQWRSIAEVLGKLAFWTASRPPHPKRRDLVRKRMPLTTALALPHGGTTLSTPRPRDPALRAAMVCNVDAYKCCSEAWGGGPACPCLSVVDAARQQEYTLWLSTRDAKDIRRRARALGPEQCDANAYEPTLHSMAPPTRPTFGHCSDDVCSSDHDVASTYNATVMRLRYAQRWLWGASAKPRIIWQSCRPTTLLRHTLG